MIALHFVCVLRLVVILFDAVNLGEAASLILAEIFTTILIFVDTFGTSIVSRLGHLTLNLTSVSVN